jgi:predicted transcriptional regulator
VASSNSFGTFLETRKLMRKGAESEEQSRRRPDHSEALTESAAVSVSLVTDHDFPLPIHELLKESGIPLDQFTDALQAIRRAGLIELRRGDDGEIVILTPKGQEFQQATREG